jgi:hypothetical protein
MPTEFFKILGGTEPVVTNLGNMTQGIGYPLRPVEPATSGGEVNIVTEILVESGSIVDQGPVALDTPYQLNFGAGDTSPQVTIDASGNVEYLEAGNYHTRLEVTIGRTATSGTALIFLRALLNGLEYPPISAGIIMDDNNITVPLFFSTTDQHSIGDILTLEIYRDSGGTNDGGTYTLTPSLGGWSPAPSASVVVSRLQAVAT